MIIDALYRYYQILAERPDAEIPSRGYGAVKVSFAVTLSAQGEIINVIPLGEQFGKRIVPVLMDVPEPPKRSGTGVSPGFLCDNSMYILGIDNKDKPDRSQLAFEASRDLHCNLLADVDEERAQAICKFFRKWSPQQGVHHPVLAPLIESIVAGSNIVFRVDGFPGYVHELPEVRSKWMRYYDQKSSEVRGQCLATGRIAPIARLHQSIKGVNGAQSSGASLVSFNLDSFTSYKKTQSFNAPVSEDAAFGYTTVLNYMLRSKKQRIQLDPNTTVVFWAERKEAGLEEDLMAQLLMPENLEGVSGLENDNSLEDKQTTQLIHDVLDRISKGQPISCDVEALDLNSRFYILGLSPNISRLSIRFWQSDTYGRLLDRIAAHYSDMDIIRPAQYQDSRLIRVDQILQETAPLGDKNRIAPLLGGGLMRSILNGTPYPMALYSAMISRIRTDHKINYIRAGLIKAVLLRNGVFGVEASSTQHPNSKMGVKITVGLDEQNTNTAYRLGRLFAVLEKAQQDASPGLNATIRDRFFGAASATPKTVFPQLLRLAQHHVAKADYGNVSDRRIESIMGDLVDFPSHLTLGEQGLFMLGYYHQRQAFYQKANEKEG